MEVDIKEVGHILLIGNRQDIREVNDFLVPYRSKEEFIPFERLLSFTRPYNLLKIGAHPFREAKGLAHLEKEVLTQLDAFDLNATDLYHQGLKMRMQLAIFAHELQLPVVAGSDTHHYLQFGSVYNELREKAATIDELRAVLMRNAYDITISPCLKEKVKAARLVKKTLKKSLSV
ncbi:PHP-associated domain-containing protein [Bacillus sp. JCM 19034]|uniref:PHP-associated domain-containing protein n=1 Tax=Bacillus sp. JCM 19034 TaxID=1481928 RepID=UPI000A7F18A3|nr:PHP-associated domain-containing protein [Bacillus sp. JCM 19034]